MAYEDIAVRLMNKFPAIEDLRLKAHRRLPLVAKAYLETGTDEEHALKYNLDAFARIRFTPRFLKGDLDPNIETTVMGVKYGAPFGIAPVGLTGLMWPGAEMIFAKTAAKYRIPYCLSTLATQTPETVGEHVGDMGWFQLYTPREEELADLLMKRARSSGFHTLVITIDIPTPSRRQRTKRAGLVMPPKITPYFIWQGITHPQWSLNTLKYGIPRLRTIEAYSDFKDMMSVGEFTQHKMGGNLSWDYVRKIRDKWKGPVILKGIMHVEDAIKAADYGFEGIVVSNHGARQFDGVRTSIEVLPEIVREVKNKTVIMLDSGIRTGLDIIRAISLGADFVLLGRAFMYGAGALGTYGGDHAAEIFIGEMKNNMAQLGVESLQEIRSLETTIMENISP